ncbi:MAG: hypothetical protein M3Q07_25270, partial [Pseudobdellovibrionaceae bacterium]|nr:hypothetical protein [Pseudobdellovibrionaceae bacterium]
MKHALLSFFLLMLTGGIQAAAPAVLKMQTDPDAMNVHPQHDTLDFRISVHQSNGTPIPRARLHVQLQAPDTPWLASTDFPVVEGTSLLDTDVQLDQGEYKFRYVPPIRGVYTLKASVTPLPGDTSFAPAEQQWQTE